MPFASPRFPSPGGRYANGRARGNAMRRGAVGVAAIIGFAAPAGGAELLVGPQAPFALPSAAAAAARPGDTVRIAPGTYYDCAVWRADRLLIEGAGAATRITDRICQGKAVFVVAADGVVIRGLALARARSLDGNAAAIRAEGRDLVLRDVLIEDSQDGVFATGAREGATLRIEDSVFRATGAAPGAPPSAAIRAGPLAALILRATTIEPGQGMAAILSRARLTDIAGSRIAAVAGGSHATIQAEGALRVADSTIAPGAGPRGRRAAILALPGDGGAGDLAVTGTRLDGDGVLLLNWSGRATRLERNLVPAGSTEATRSGAWWSALRRLARRAIDGGIALVRSVGAWLRDAVAQAGR